MTVVSCYLGQELGTPVFRFGGPGVFLFMSFFRVGSGLRDLCGVLVLRVTLIDVGSSRFSREVVIQER